MKGRSGRPFSASATPPAVVPQPAELHRAVTTRRAPSAPPAGAAQRAQQAAAGAAAADAGRGGGPAAAPLGSFQNTRHTARPLDSAAVLRGTAAGGARAASPSTPTDRHAEHAPAGAGAAAGAQPPREKPKEGQSSPGAEQPPEDRLTRENRGSVLHIRRPSELRLANPERFNLDRKRLTACPVLECEERLKLLNYQNNFITQISNLHGLPNLVFLDLYNNSIRSISGLESVPTLRVLMLGRNAVEKIEGLGGLPRLDVLDLHNNCIEVFENIDHLSELRVLNLAGNRLREVSQVRGMRALTEINLRRNCISSVGGLDQLPYLQRVFLSNNELKSTQDCSCLWASRSLAELSLDGNPMATDPAYRQSVIERARVLRHLDAKRVSEEERRVATAIARREEERQQERARREAAISERHDALAHIQRTWDAGMGELSGVVSTPTPSEEGVPDSAKRTKGDSRAASSADTAREKRKGFMEVDAASGVVTVYGSGAEWALPAGVDAAAVRCVAFECVAFGRVVSHFIPRMAALPSLTTVRLAHNGVTSFAQIAQLSKLPHLEELEVEHNAVLDSSALLRRFLTTALPRLRSFNGQELAARLPRYGGTTITPAPVPASCCKSRWGSSPARCPSSCATHSSPPRSTAGRRPPRRPASRPATSRRWSGTRRRSTPRSSS
eukprot:TRINITY_DN15471_c0_g1_i2.p1 TRINITY_DN15471_c0_g1~~TRINITY_DN15471_c0_g1_i2.p1  ORF type:complete len:696 (+),score=205.49 TRINITY_DN15471_c0_g1_i2:76-2088(+)